MKTWRLGLVVTLAVVGLVAMSASAAPSLIIRVVNPVIVSGTGIITATDGNIATVVGLTQGSEVAGTLQALIAYGTSKTNVHFALLGGGVGGTSHGLTGVIDANILTNTPWKFDPDGTVNSGNVFSSPDSNAFKNDPNYGLAGAASRFSWNNDGTRDVGIPAAANYNKDSNFTVLAIASDAVLTGGTAAGTRATTVIGGVNYVIFSLADITFTNTSTTGGTTSVDFIGSNDTPGGGFMQFRTGLTGSVFEAEPGNAADIQYNGLSITGLAVPEPVTMVILGLGSVGLFLRRRRA